MFRCSLTAAAILLLCVFAVYGQGLSSLTGVVTDPTGAVIPGATISITNTQTGAQRDTTSDKEGRYNIPLVQPGTYKLVAKASGLMLVGISFGFGNAVPVGSKRLTSKSTTLNMFV